MSQALEAVHGVVDATVSFDDARADVTYDPAAVSPQRLVEAINKTGFVASLPKDAAERDEADAQREAGERGVRKESR